MKAFRNLTPHPVTITGFAPIPPSGDVARVSVARQPIGDINGIPCYAPTFGAIEGLPEPQPSLIYIVSALVRTHPDASHRSDVASPGLLVRDASGAIVGCDGLDFNS